MSAGERERLLREAAALKLRALRQAAVGDAEERWEAIALYRDAAQKELASLGCRTSLEQASAAGEAEEVEARVEACGLYLAARDPIRALREWARLPEGAFSAGAGEAPVAAIKALFAAGVAGLGRAFRELFGAGPIAVAGLSPDQVRALLDEYPGVAELWWALSRCAVSPMEAELCRERALRLEPGLADDGVAQTAFGAVEAALAPGLSLTLSALPGCAIGLEAAGRILAGFAALLAGFAESTSGAAVSAVLTGARAGADPGTFTATFSAPGLHPFALEELDRELGEATGRQDARTELALLSLLHEHRVTLAVWAAAQPHQGGLVIDEQRRKRLLAAGGQAALRGLDPRDVPQADDIEKVFRAVARIVAGDSELLDLTPRQMSYYRRAAKALGLLTEDEAPAPAGRLIARLSGEARLRAGAVLFEASRCGDAWVRWAGGRSLLDVDAKSAGDFLRSSVPGLGKETAERRAQTLAAWHRVLVGRHYLGR